jgi:hypothetical protein
MILVVLLAALGITAVTAPGASATGTLELSSTSGTPGTSVTAVGRGFPRRTIGDVSFDGTEVATFRTDRRGNVKVSFVVPAVSARTAAVRMAAGATAVTAAFNVISPALLTTPPAPTVVKPLRLGDFNTGDFSQWDKGGASVAPTSGAQVVLDSARVYDGTYAARAHVPSGDGNKYARTLWGDSSGGSTALNYGEGHDFWYGTAIYLPAGFHESMQSYFVPMRWDNFGVTNVSRGGLSMWKDGTIRLFRERSGVEAQTNLLGSTTFRLTEGAWHWLEVHQKLSSTDGNAVNELYVDGQLIGKSTSRNFYGEPVGAMRFGIVALSSSAQTQPLTLWYDRATISSTRIGVLPL